MACPQWAFYSKEILVIFRKSIRYGNITIFLFYFNIFTILFSHLNLHSMKKFFWHMLQTSFYVFQMISQLSPTPSFPFVKGDLKSHVYHCTTFLIMFWSIVLTSQSYSSTGIFWLSSSSLLCDRSNLLFSFVLTFHTCVGYCSMLFLLGDLKNYFANSLKIQWD